MRSAFQAPPQNNVAVKEKDMDDNMKAGDKVIALAAAATTAAVIAGAVAGAVSTWIATQRFSACFLALLAGGVIGLFVGRIVGALLFPAADGNVQVAEWGPRSIPFTLKGNIVASVVASVVVSGLIGLVTDAPFIAIAGPGVGVAIVLGLILALLTSLL